MVQTEKNSVLKYIGTPYADLLVPHSDQIPVPKRPSPTEEYIPPTFETIESTEKPVSMFQPSNVSQPCNHIPITQTRFDIIVQRLKLSQRQSALLANELKQSNLLVPEES